MKTKTGMSIGLALTLMVGVFATMLALGLFTTTPQVGADHSPPSQEPPTNEHDTLKGAGMVDPFTLSVDHSPKSPGVPAKVTVTFDTPVALSVAEDAVIVIEFNDDVKMPATFDRDDITITADETEGARRIANPHDVVLSRVGIPPDEPLIVLSVPNMNPDRDNPTIESIALGETVTVIFRQSAGITNPTEAGTWAVKVSAGTDAEATRTTSLNVKMGDTLTWVDTAVPPPDPLVEPMDADATQDYKNSFTTLRELTLSSKSGSRGSTVKATGKGFKDKTTATVWLDNKPQMYFVATTEEPIMATTVRTKDETMFKDESTGPGVRESGEPVLCTALVDGTDTFTCSFVVNAPPFVSSAKNMINATDGRAGEATKRSEWSLTPKITAVPDTAAVGDTVTIELRDFKIGSRYVSEAAATDDNLKTGTFKLGGVAIPTSFTINSSLEAVTITVPNGVPLGQQSLDVKLNDPTGDGDSGTKRDTMSILGAQVEVTPSMVVPNQSVTVNGRGFSGRVGGVLSSLNQVLIGGTVVDRSKIDGGDPVLIDEGGNWVATIVIPVESPAIVPGTYEFKAIDNRNRPGVTEITIAPRTVEFTPKESRVGTTVTVIGTGWPAINSTAGAKNASIEVEYFLAASNSSSSSARATPNSDGDFSTTISVPLGASIPSTNKVTVSYTTKPDGGRAEETVSEVVAHRVPGASLEVSPSSGVAGTVATLTGGGFKAFTSLGDVTVGGIKVQPRPVGASVARDGILASSEILIPGLDPGTHTVRADVGDTVVNVAFTITADDAPLPSTGDQSPADAFKVLIDSGNLLTVYSFDEENQVYLSYDPDPANAGFNDLDMVSGGEAYWVRLTADTTFLGKTRYAEWSLVVLP